MASVLKKGASGSEVKTLQNALNGKGYQLDADGIFGSRTESALRDFQSRNALTADGIAGAQTWAKLNGSSASPKKTAAKAAPAAAETKVTAFGNEYDPASTTAAAADLAAREAAAPQAFVSPNAAREKQLTDALAAREPFSYDLADDPLYRQYRREVLDNAQRAMTDARGAAAAATGGYGSSYAETAGQQAYRSYLDGLGSLVPELYTQARTNHDSVYEDALRELQALQADDDAAYKRWSDDYDRYMDWLDYQYGKLTDEQAQRNWEKQFKKKK